MVSPVLLGLVSFVLGRVVFLGGGPLLLCAVFGWDGMLVVVGWSLAIFGGGPFVWWQCLWVRFPPAPGWLLVLALVVPRHSWWRGLWRSSPPTLAGACCWFWCGGRSLTFLGRGLVWVACSPVAVLVGAVPSRSWLGAGAGFGGPSPFMVEGSVGVVPRRSWLGPAAGFGAVGGPSPPLAGGLAVGLFGWPAVLWQCSWVWVPAIPGWGLVVALVGGPSPILAEGPAGVVSRLGSAVGVGGQSLASLGGGPWARFPAIPGWGPLVTGGWSLANPGGGSWVLFSAIPGWVCCWRWWVVPRQSWRRALGAVPRHPWLGSGVGVGGWSLANPGGGPWAQFPSILGWGPDVGGWPLANRG